MDYMTLKDMMRKYLGNQVDSNELKHLFLDDPENYYSDWYHCFSDQGLTHLHKCILLVNKYPNLNNYLEEYLETGEHINEKTNLGYTALHIASLYSGVKNTNKTVKILIKAGSTCNYQQRNIEYINLQNNYGSTALHCVANRYCIFPDKKFIKIILILIKSGADIFNIRDSRDKTVYDSFTLELKEYLQINIVTKTINILSE